MSVKMIGLDIGGTNIRAGLVDEDNAVTGFQKRSSHEMISEGEGLKKLSGFISSFMEEPVQGVVVGIPGTLNRDRTRILSCPNLPALNGCELGAVLERELGIPAFLERDVNLLMLNDMLEFGDDGLVIGCYVGTGLGNAIAVNGLLLNGKDGAAGELGHIPLLGKTEPCTCGNIGCLENYASGRFLERLVADHFKGTPLGQVFLRHSDHPVILEYINTLATGVAIEVNILNPERVILGGGVLGMEGFPREALGAAIRRHTRKPEPSNSLTLCFSKDSPYGGVIGAAVCGRQKRNGWESL